MGILLLDSIYYKKFEVLTLFAEQKATKRIIKAVDLEKPRLDDNEKGEKERLNQMDLLQWQGRKGLSNYSITILNPFLRNIWSNRVLELLSKQKRFANLVWGVCKTQGFGFAEIVELTEYIYFRSQDLRDRCLPTPRPCQFNFFFCKNLFINQSTLLLTVPLAIFDILSYLSKIFSSSKQNTHLSLYESKI